ncbi:class I SAM-dependent methyltransferase [Bacillus spongiae]|uniref:Class I SAM-dependent methyltransferase n=1 Tax=Bacillus spongiae TaxID=2683610 RepID=A0ABU8HD54_9BACI
MDIKKKVQEQFGQFAGNYVTSEIHAKGEDLHTLIALSGVKPKDVVLDIATGGGHVANGIAPFAKKVVALDLTEKMLKEAERFIRQNGYENVEFIKGDAEKLPFPSKTFSAVTCRIAPHHFPNVNDFVLESYRVLKDGGTFLLIDNVVPEQNELDIFYNEIEKKRDPSHFRAWKKTEWLTMIERVGFEVEQLTSFWKMFTFESWFARMGLPVQEKRELEQYMLSASPETRNYYRVKEENGRVVSFQGKSVLIKAKKRH